MKKENSNYGKHRKEMKILFDSLEKIVHLIKEGKASSSEYNNEILRNNLTRDDVMEIEDISKVTNEDEYVERLSRLTTKIYFRKMFNEKNDDFKKVVYEMLKNKDLSLNPETLHRNVNAARNKLKLYGKVADDVYYFLTEVQKMQNSSEIFDTIVAEFEGKKYVAPSYGRDTGNGRGNAPRVDEPTRMNVSAMEILRKYRDRFAELNNQINSERKYFITISRMLENKILPTSKEGQALLKSIGLSEDVVEEYFDLLNRITIALSINHNEKEIIAFIRGLSNAEYEFIADLESECLSLDDQEGMQMLSERCVNREKVEQFYKYLKLAKVREKRELIELKNKQLKDMFDKLNLFEKSLIEDMIAECLTPENQEGMQMISERCVDEKKIRAYFELRKIIDQDIKDANDLGESLNPRKVPEKASEKGTESKLENDSEKDPSKVPEKASEKDPNKALETNPEKEEPNKNTEARTLSKGVVNNKGTNKLLREADRNRRILNDQGFFKRVSDFFGRIFDKRRINKMARDNSPSSKIDEQPSVLDRLKGYKIHNLDEYDDELQRMNSGGMGR